MLRAVRALGAMRAHRRQFDFVERVVNERCVVIAKTAAVHGRPAYPRKWTGVPPEPKKNRLGAQHSGGLYRQRNAGAMISANEVRARFNRDFTVPRLHAVISAISSYDLPSSSRRMNTCR